RSSSDVAKGGGKAGADTPDGSASSSTGPGGPFGDFADSGGGGAFVDAACATDVHKSEASALDLYIMQDQSGSMKDLEKWTSVQAAFNAFVQSPGAAG